MEVNQKNSIISTLRLNTSYKNNYLVEYKQCFDVEEDFFDFCCERGKGKDKYILAFNQLEGLDPKVRIFSELYGVEEDEKDVWVSIETLIIISTLSLEEIKKCFMGLDRVDEYLYPSDIGEIIGKLDSYLVINDDGKQFPLSQFVGSKEKIYYCWWD